MASPRKLKERYEVREILGRGGMGVVYRAYDPVVKREVAVKTLRDAPSRTALQLFYKECDVLASMSHPNIVEIFDVGEYEEEGVSKPYFVMPLLRGVSLDRIIATSSQRLTTDRVVDILTQACRGLHAAHERGLIHRDLKPSNIFVMEDDSVRIIDFGLAHVVDAQSSTGQKGTLLYMAPEQIEMKPLSPQTDIYALGVTTYEALTGRLPWERGSMAEIARAILHQAPPPASELNPQISQAVSRVIHKAMAKQPRHRYASAREFGEMLQRAFRNEVIEAFDPGRIRPRIERASRAFEQGDYQFALEILTELEAEGHIDPEISSLQRQIDLASRRKTILQLLESARRRIEGEEYPLALQKIQEVLELEPDNADALSLKSRIETGRRERQIDEWMSLARQHVESYRFGHARDAIQNVLEQNSRDSRALQMLSDIDRREQEYRSELAEKEQLYRDAMEDYHQGELSTALSKLQRVLELDRRAPDSSSPGSGATYQNFYNQIRSQHDAINNAYADARAHLGNRNFAKALAICEELLAKNPGHALFQALKFEVEEQQRQELSSYIAEVDRRVEAEPDLDRRTNILREAADRYPDELHFKKALRLMRDKCDLVNSIVAKARQNEERGQFNEALGQWEILRNIHSQYPGLDFEVERVMKRREQQSRQATKARWVQQIDRQLEAGDYARAAELLKNALEESPGDAELAELEKVTAQAAEIREQAEKLLAEGQSLCAEQKFDEGIDALRRAYLMDQRSAVARAILVSTLAERARAVLDSDWHSADALLQEALELDSSHLLARSLRTLVDDRKREEVVDQCVARARQLQAAGDLEGALAAVEEGLASYPRTPRLVQLQETLLRSMPESQRSKLRQSELERATEAVTATNLMPAAPPVPPPAKGPAPAPGETGETAVITQGFAATGAEQPVAEPQAPPPAAEPAPPASEVTQELQRPVPPAAPAPEQTVEAPAASPRFSAGGPPAAEPLAAAAPPPAAVSRPEVAEEPVARRPSRRETEPEPRKKIPVPAIVGVAAVALIAVVYLGWFRGGNASEPAAPPPVEQTTAPAEPSTPPAAGESARPVPEPPAAEQEPPPAPRQTEAAPVAAREDPATPVENTLAIETSPPGAMVVFDNNQATSCLSPCSLSLPHGRHVASATLAGYRQALKIFEVPKESTLVLELIPMIGMVRITSEPAGSSIVVNGQARSETTPATLKLPAGKYVVSVRKEGYRASDQELEVKDSAFLTLEFTLTK